MQLLDLLVGLQVFVQLKTLHEEFLNYSRGLPIFCLLFDFQSLIHFDDVTGGFLVLLQLLMKPLGMQQVSGVRLDRNLFRNGLLCYVLVAHFNLLALSDLC